MISQASLFRLLDLPTELVVEICWFSNNAALILVCRRIRELMYSNTRFWTKVSIGKPRATPGSTTSTYHNRRERAELYPPSATLLLRKRLDRSANHPLNIEIQAEYPTVAIEGELWEFLAGERNRFLSLTISAPSSLVGNILVTIFPKDGYSALPTLKKAKFLQRGREVVGGLRTLELLHDRISRSTSMFHELTMLTLSFTMLFIPYLASPLLSLEILILDGSAGSAPHATDYQVADFLTHTPNLETLWCKFKPNTNDYFTFSQGTILPDSNFPNDIPPIEKRRRVDLPVVLPHLTSVAVTVPSCVALLLHGIRAPQLHDMHLDGTTHYKISSLDMLHSCPAYTALKATSTYAPAVRRIALIGAQVHEEGWRELLGCADTARPLFPLLQSVAVRGVDAAACVAPHGIDEEVVRKYACVGAGCLTLRRFVCTGSEPKLDDAVISELVCASVQRLGPDEHFELEVDDIGAVDVASTLADVQRVRVKHHREKVKMTGWWNVDKLIDPREADWY